MCFFFLQAQPDSVGFRVCPCSSKRPYHDETVRYVRKGCCLLYTGHIVDRNSYLVEECRDCMLRESCLYTLVFENHEAGSQPGAKGALSPPHPFVIEPPMDGERRFQAGERFECTLLLFGEANERLPYFVYAFEQMGQIGIGGRVNGNRGRFVLEDVQAGGRAVYSEGTRKLLKADGLETLCLSSADKHATGIRLTLETPLRLKFENRLTAELPFHVLVRAMLRRVSSLFNAFGNGEPELDYKGLVREAQAVRTKESSLRWFDWVQRQGPLRMSS